MSSKKKNKANAKEKTVSRPDRKARAGRRALRNSLFAIVVSLFSIAVLIFVIHYLFDFIAAKPKFEFISNGRIEHTIGTKALIVRDESVIPSKAKGDLVTKATEGSRVASFQDIAMVVPENMSTVLTNLRNTQSQISEVQQEVIAAGNAAGARHIYEKVDEDILPIIDLLRTDAGLGKLSDISSYESSLSVLMDKREKELKSIDFQDKRISSLRSNEKSYSELLQDHAAVIRATEPGIVSYKLDGLEEQLSFAYLQTADPSEISDLLDEAQGVIQSDLLVQEDENVVRIAKNEKQEFAVLLKGKDVQYEKFAVDSTHNINIASEGVTIDNCKVVRSTPCDDGLLVVFETSRHVESLVGLRSVNIEIVINSTAGLRVAVSSLVEPDYDRQIATIYVNDNGFATAVSVLIKDYDREFAIIAPLGADDTVPNNRTVIISNPSSVKPGDEVE